MKKKRLTPNQKAFYAEVERIKRAMARYRKKGYVFSDDIIPEKPQRVTKKYLAELKKFKGKKIAAEGEYKPFRMDIDFPDEPPRIVAAILNHVRELIRMWQPKLEWSDKFAEIKRQDKNTIERLLDGAIAEDGEVKVAMNLESNAEEAIRLVEAILYGNSGDARDGGDYARASIVAFGRIIKGRALTMEESIDLTEFADAQMV